MLVLTRTVNEKITIGDVVITIVSVRGRRVGVGIEAPRSVNIVRDDVAGTNEGEEHAGKHPGGNSVRRARRGRP